jgi:hypothetical protein
VDGGQRLQPGGGVIEIKHSTQTLNQLPQPLCVCRAFTLIASRVQRRDLHSLTLELTLSNSRTHSSIKLGHTVDRRAQVELKWERV